MKLFFKKRWMCILEWRKLGIIIECDTFCLGLLKGQKENGGIWRHSLRLNNSRQVLKSPALGWAQQVLWIQSSWTGNWLSSTQTLVVCQDPQHIQDGGWGADTFCWPMHTPDNVAGESNLPLPLQRQTDPVLLWVIKVNAFFSVTGKKEKEDERTEARGWGQTEGREDQEKTRRHFPPSLFN